MIAAIQSKSSSATTDKHSGLNIPVAAGTMYPSPASPEHQFEWPVRGLQFNHMQPNESWMTSANAQYYQPNNQQPFFTIPNYNRPQTVWPRHDSCYHMETKLQSGPKTQGCNNAKNQDAGLPSGISKVPRNASNAFATHSARARRGHVADT